MELKDYQQDVLDDIKKYISHYIKEGNPKDAYRNYWEDRNVRLDATSEYLHPYVDKVTGVPNVTVKVPTAGGKTFIACNAIRTMFDEMPERGKVVVWFVPSDTILNQTYQNLSNPLHPYRQKINSLFNNRVCVVDKETALTGNGISPTEISEQLTIFVLSIQSFVETNRKKNTRSQSYLKKPLVYRENGNLDFNLQDYYDSNIRIEGADETSLIQYIAWLNPMVVIDESHNFSSDLRIDTLTAINPAFVLDLTATPRQDSNVISFIDAYRLKKANMVKLPVIVSNNYDKNDVIANAILLRRNLEEHAKEAQKNGGDYIRPIILFQAEPKTSEDTETYEKLKKSLVKSGISEDEIKIKTANVDELKGLDLMSSDCPVRYIITVNALKEGWDCPFAYILATIANRSSKVDVEQIVGRVLRQPYTRNQSDALLNMSYVLTCSAEFNDTVQEIVNSLNYAGFSGKDFRVAENQSAAEPDLPRQTPKEAELFNSTEDNDLPNEDNVSSSGDEDDELDVSRFKGLADSANVSSTMVDGIESQARRQSEDYNNELDTQPTNNNKSLPNDVKQNMKIYPIKDFLKEEADDICLPNFFIQTENQVLFEVAAEGGREPLNGKLLLKGFDLSKQNSEINFDLSAEVRAVDLEQRQSDEYVARSNKLTDWQFGTLRNAMTSGDKNKKLKYATDYFSRELESDNDLGHRACRQYVANVLQNKSEDELLRLIDLRIATVARFKEKIKGLKNEYAARKFSELCDTNKIIALPQYHFPDSITAIQTAPSIPKMLYIEEEGKMNDYEKAVIRKIADLDNVLFWHRNQEHGIGFRINGYIQDHYPDFIVVTKNHAVVLIETKGGYLANPDSAYKIRIGRKWADMAGNGYKYFMAFPDDVKPLEGAMTVSEMLQRLKDL